MFTTILSAIAAIPELLGAVRELLATFKRAETEGWFKKNNAAFEALKTAKTPEELLNAAKAIQDSIAHL